MLNLDVDLSPQESDDAGAAPPPPPPVEEGPSDLARRLLLHDPTLRARLLDKRLPIVRPGIDYGVIENENAKKFPWLKWGLIAGGVGLGIVLLSRALRKRRSS